MADGSCIVQAECFAVVVAVPSVVTGTSRQCGVPAVQNENGLQPWGFSIPLLRGSCVLPQTAWQRPAEVWPRQLQRAEGWPKPVATDRVTVIEWPFFFFYCITRLHLLFP